MAAGAISRGKLVIMSSLKRVPELSRAVPSPASAPDAGLPIDEAARLVDGFVDETATPALDAVIQAALSAHSPGPIKLMAESVTGHCKLLLEEVERYKAVNFRR